MGSRPSSLRDTVTTDVKILAASPDVANIPLEHSAQTDETKDIPTLETRHDRSYLKEPLLVIAIDFGTSYSGYAFSFKCNKGKLLTANHGNVFWDDRVPTIVLLNPDKTFNSFGYEAQETYSKLDEKRDSYYYCEHFKMAVYETMKSSKLTELRDNQNRPVQAQEVMAMLIKELLELAFETVKELRKEDIALIITIPARWSVFAKQIMHQSAVSAGIHENNLCFVLEPYAASLHCIQTDAILGQSGELDQYELGRKFILADLGGGSADICVYEVEGERKLKELYRATRDSVGGLSVNSQFQSLIETLVGPAVWSEFQKDHASSFQDLMRDFERKKKTFSSEKGTVTMSIDSSLLQILERKTGESLEDVVKKKNFTDKIRFKSVFHKLLLKKEIMEEFFKPSVDGILNLFEDTLDRCQDLNLHTMFLVGGYSESPYLRQKIQSKFNSIRIMFYGDASLAILKGAVMLGHETNGSKSSDMFM